VIGRRIEQEKEKGGGHGEDGPPSLTRVVPVQQEQEQQQKTTLRKEIIALKWQRNIRRTLMNNTDPTQTFGQAISSETQPNMENTKSGRDSNHTSKPS
jgi:hypothetical protein